MSRSGDGWGTIPKDLNVLVKWEKGKLSNFFDLAKEIIKRMIVKGHK